MNSDQLNQRLLESNKKSVLLYQQRQRLQEKIAIYNNQVQLTNMEIAQVELEMAKADGEEEILKVLIENAKQEESGLKLVAKETANG